MTADKEGDGSPIYISIRLVRGMTDAVDEFIASLRDRFSENTIQAYSTDLRQFSSFVLENAVGADEGEVWRALDATLVEGYLTHLRAGKGYRATTVARKMAATRTFCSYLVASGLLESDPAESLHVSVARRMPPEYLSDQEMDALMSAAEAASTPEARRDAAMLHVLASTGMKVGELVAINVDDVDFNDSCIAVRGPARRTVYMEPETRERLRAYITGDRSILLGHHLSNAALFPNRRGERLSRQWVWSVLNTAGQIAGFGKRMGPHTLRHTFAYRQLRSGTSLAHLQEMLGIQNAVSARIYMQFIGDPDEHAKVR